MASETFARGDKVLLPRGRKPYTVMSVSDEGTLNIKRAGRQPSATRRRYRGIGTNGDEWLWNVDPATVTRYTPSP